MKIHNPKEQVGAKSFIKASTKTKPEGSQSEPFEDKTAIHNQITDAKIYKNQRGSKEHDLNERNKRQLWRQYAKWNRIWGSRRKDFVNSASIEEENGKGPMSYCLRWSAAGDTTDRRGSLRKRYIPGPNRVWRYQGDSAPDNAPGRHQQRSKFIDIRLFEILKDMLT